MRGFGAFAANAMSAPGSEARMSGESVGLDFGCGGIFRRDGTLGDASLGWLSIFGNEWVLACRSSQGFRQFRAGTHRRGLPWGRGRLRRLGVDWLNKYNGWPYEKAGIGACIGEFNAGR